MCALVCDREGEREVKKTCQDASSELLTTVVLHLANMRSWDHVGMGQNSTTGGPQLLVHGSIYQGSISGTHF